MKLWIIVAGLVVCLFILGLSLTGAFKKQLNMDDLMYDRVFGSQSYSSSILNSSSVDGSNNTSESQGTGEEQSSDESQVTSASSQDNSQGNKSSLSDDKARKEQLLKQYQEELDKHKKKVQEYTVLIDAINESM